MRLSRSALLWTLLATLSLLQCAHADGPLREWLQQRRNPATVAGTTTEHSIRSGGTDRHYLLHLPKGYDPARPAALILAFHGGGGSMAHMAKDNTYGIVDSSDRAGYIVAFPNGSGAVGDKLATWNAGNCCGKARDQQVDDVAFARAVVADIQQRHRIDSGRIYAMGMSNGGMLSHRLACEAADLFAAVAAVAGTDNSRNCQPSQPISVLQIHARDDDHVLYEGGAGPDAFRDQSKVTDFVSVPATIANWVARNQCSGSPRELLAVAGARCERYEQCRDGARVQLCVTDEGKHSWPGSNITTLSRQQPSQAIDANTVIWEFFQAVQR